MIELYPWSTPNGRKVSIMLEECGLPYAVLDRHLAQHPWVARHEWHQVDLAAYPAVLRWFRALGARLAVQRGMVVPG